jgi:hypothetical protein
MWRCGSLWVELGLLESLQTGRRPGSLQAQRVGEEISKNRGIHVGASGCRCYSSAGRRMSKLGYASRISDLDAQDAAKWVRRRRTRKSLRRASPLRQLAMLRGEVVPARLLSPLSVSAPYGASRACQTASSMKIVGPFDEVRTSPLPSPPHALTPVQAGGGGQALPAQLRANPKRLAESGQPFTATCNFVSGELEWEAALSRC